MKRLVSRTALLTQTIYNEIRGISRSLSTVLVLLGGVVAYGLLYNLLYRPNVVNEVPTVVVDLSRSEASRRLTELIDASPRVQIVESLDDLHSAQQAVAQGIAEGAILIPHDLGERLHRGEQALFVAIGSTNQFLNYEAIQSGALGAMQFADSQLRANAVAHLPTDVAQKLLLTKPIEVVGTALYNPTRGYADYLMPAVLVAILFQTMLMAIAIRTGAERSQGTLIHYARRGTGWSSVAIVVVGRGVVYVVLYAVFALFLLGLLPIVFDLPRLGNPLTITALIVPFLIATASLGQAFGMLFRDSEGALLLIAFFSVGLLFLSGMSYPVTLLPPFWRAVHYLLPAPTTILGYIKAASMGATTAEVCPHIATLWAQAVGWFVIAVLTLRTTLRRAVSQALNGQ